MIMRRFNGENGEICNFDYGWKISYSYKTLISTTNGGGEQRRARWEHPIRYYTLPLKNKNLSDLQKLQQFFRDMKGRYDKFLFFDDTSDTLQTIGAGSIITDTGEITKFYLPYSNVYPLDGSPSIGTDIKVYIDGVERVSDITYTRTNDVIEFTVNKPADSSTITVKYRYYVVVRFDMDKIDITENTFKIGETSVNLIEVR